MKVDIENGLMVVDGEAHLTICPRTSSALKFTKAYMDSGNRGHVKNFRFAFAVGKTRLGRWWSLCRHMWEFSK